MTKNVLCYLPPATAAVNYSSRKISSSLEIFSAEVKEQDSPETQIGCIAPTNNAVGKSEN